MNLKMASSDRKSVCRTSRAEHQNGTAPESLLDATPRDNPESLLQALRSTKNPSLVTSIYPINLGQARYEILKSLVLGKRAGGTPIRLALFGGLDPGKTETIAAVAKLLMLLTLGPTLAEDYAVFGYPWIHPGGFAADGTSNKASGELATRWADDSEAPDALFFRGEFQRIAPNGIITLRSTENSNALRARANSSIISEEVVKPALHRLKSLVLVQENPVEVISRDESYRRSQFVNGRLIPYPDTQPWPLDIELEVPAHLSLEIKVQVLVLATLDILRTYRAFVCHGGDL